MLDEDTVLKSTRYASERYLVVYVVIAACLPAIFNGGESIFALCTFFAMGIFALINVISFPINWIDAPEYTRTRFFAALSPILAIVIFSIYRMTTPALEKITMSQIEFFVQKNDSSFLSGANFDAYAGTSNSLFLLSIAIIAISIPAITQSRFVLQSIIFICTAFFTVLALLGFFFGWIDVMLQSSIKNIFSENSFACFSERTDFAFLCYIWGILTFAMAIYTKQRFKIENLFSCTRTYILLVGAFLFFCAYYNANEILKPFIFASSAIVGAIYAYDTIPNKKNFKRHWDIKHGPMPKKRVTSKLLAPIIIYSLIAVCTTVFFALSFSDYIELARETQNPLLDNIKADTNAVIEARPLLGWGLYSFSDILKFFQGDDIQYYGKITPLTDYDDMLVSVGIIGVALLLLTPLVKLIKTIVGNLKSKILISRAGIIMFSGIAFILIMACYSSFLVNPCVLFSFMILIFTFFAWEDAEII